MKKNNVKFTFINENTVRLFSTAVVVLSIGPLSTMASCTGLTPSIEDMLKTDTVKEQTLMDELEMTEPGTVIEKTEKLESVIRVYDKIKNKNYDKKVEKLTNDDEDELICLTEKEVSELIKKADNKQPENKKELAEKEESQQTIVNLKHVTKEWIEENGYPLSYDFLLNTIKCSAADSFGLTIEEYPQVSIPWKEDKDVNGIRVGYDVYAVEKGSVLDKSMTFLKQMNDGTKERSIETYRKALDQSKELLESGTDFSTKYNTFENKTK